ncbi:MAG: hypothetical protein RBT36_03265 [Desulfobulbus sp.]|jgi:phenylacetate-CoA ligase|nr:hypothetical protein [Desulfobulbus sp.]
MDLLAPLSRNFIAPLWALWEGSPYLHHYRRFLETQFDPVEIIEKKQLEDVRKISTFAYNSVPFWKDRFDSSGLDPLSISSLPCLHKLPLLTKADLREQGDLLLSQKLLKGLHQHTTSGSTGVSVTVYRDEPCQQFKRGATLRCDEWTGWRLGERVAAIWGNPEIRTDWKGRLRHILLDRTSVYLDTLKMNEQSMQVFAEALLAQQPSLLFGHAHSLYLFASFLRAKRPEARIRPKGILSTCMVLHDFERELIASVFDCPVINRYGCEEVSLIACECRAGEGLHVNAECVYVELLDEQGEPCPPGKPGRVVVTDLHNRAMPMIRYEVGDMAVWADKPCSCGRTLPLLARVEGRVADYVLTRAGDYISGISLTENFAVKIPGVAQMQIVQEEIGRFTFNIVKGRDFSNQSLAVLAEQVDRHFGTGTRYTIAYLDTIPQEPSGKYRFCISKVRRCFD